MCTTKRRDSKCVRQLISTIPVIVIITCRLSSGRQQIARDTRTGYVNDKSRSNLELEVSGPTNATHESTLTVNKSLTSLAL